MPYGWHPYDSNLLHFNVFRAGDDYGLHVGCSICASVAAEFYA
jgi:hypothetical protein